MGCELMLNKRELINSIMVAFFAQGIAMFVSVVQMLIVPKVLGVEEFAYWQLFVFYIGYVGFFHLGLSSGVYLKMGGKSRPQFDKSSAKSQFIFGLTYQLVMAIVMAMIGCSMSDADRGFVLTQTAIYLLIANACTYLTNILQCMNETKKSSFSYMIAKVSYLIPLLLMMALGVRSFHPYIIAYNFASLLQLAYCLWELRDFAQVPPLDIRRTLEEGFDSIKVGASLMCANIASSLILGASRFVVDWAWGLETFGKLSLMFSIVGFFLMFVNQVGLVLFPALKSTDAVSMASFYMKARDCLGLFLPIIYVLFFPMCCLIRAWLLDYADALNYLALLMPICMFDSLMGVVGNTYLQVRRREKKMLKVNVCTAMLSTIISFMGAVVFKSTWVVVAGPSIAIAARSLYTDRYVVNEMGLDYQTTGPGEIIMSLVFLGCTAFSPMYAMVVVSVSYGIYLYVYRKRVVRSINQFTSVFAG